ncbi:polysaccharide deacetylase family protein [uncultured Desulfosarcina sp.]|uniref:polysaccharide deacetylase family protein n=1 Tax=uncultured Desulfosarcina sp. TaxID=218289 RepID=UPI0029C87D2A|nr:polysaccharide deacetylase family protein [uncultured Desulfosarcina sp.]
MAKKMTKNGLRILCYHGITDSDVTEWNPGLFIYPDDLKRRLKYLSDNNFPVISLEESGNYLKQNKLPPYATVITIDDGFFNTISHGRNVLKKFGYPYTVYISTYYSKIQDPVFSLAVPYILWKTEKKKSVFSSIGIELTNNEWIKNSILSTQIQKNIIDYGQKLCTQEKRNRILIELGDLLEVNSKDLFKNRKLSYMNRLEIQKLASEGVDIQLHTHRHNWPLNKKNAFKEIDENRYFLEPLVGKKLNHFCYPSGFWREEQIEFLMEKGIKTATTCDSGFNYPNTNLYLLRRFVDNSKKNMIEFEALINGFYQIFYKFTKSKTYSRNSGYNCT